MAPTQVPLAARVAGIIPDRLLVALIARAHTRFEPDLGRLEAMLPAQRRTAIDVGAWYGPWSLALGRHFDRVVAFEPNPAVANRLRGALPHNVELIESAVSDRAGTATLQSPATLGAEGVGTLVSGDAAPVQSGWTTTEVATCTLDSLDLEAVDFVKIDAEGHELAVLTGARKMFEEHRPVLVVELEERLAPVAPVLELLTAAGYRAHTLQAGVLAPFDPLRLVTVPAPSPRGYLSAVLRPDRDRVNNVVFLPGEQAP